MNDDYRQILIDVGSCGRGLFITQKLRDAIFNCRMDSRHLADQLGEQRELNDELRRLSDRLQEEVNGLEAENRALRLQRAHFAEWVDCIEDVLKAVREDIDGL